MILFELVLDLLFNMLSPAYDILPMGFAPKSGGEIVNTLRPVTLLDGISGEIWQECLELAEQFYTLANSCNCFSDNFSPCLKALRSIFRIISARIVMTLITL